MKLDSDAVGIRFAAAAALPHAVSREDAIAAAREAIGRLVAGATVTAMTGIASDDSAYTVRAGSTERVYTLRDRPVWLVAFSNVNAYARGGPTDPNDPGFVVNHEVNVLVDQVTGKALRSYSYR